MVEYWMRFHKAGGCPWWIVEEMARFDGGRIIYARGGDGCAVALLSGRG